MNTMKANHEQTPDVLIKDLIERRPILGKAAQDGLKHGISLEPTARKELKKILPRNGHKMLNFCDDDPGMTIDKDHPFVSRCGFNVFCNIVGLSRFLRF